MLDWLRFILTTGFLLSGLVILVTAVIGVYKFDYVLNRMHAAAIGDSVGILFIAIGTMILFCDLFPILKILLVVAFLWITSPVSAHQITRVEILTNPRLIEHLTGQDMTPGEGE